MESPPGGEVHGSFFTGYVQLASQNLCPISTMLWPVIDPVFVRFWARPEWIWSCLLNIKIL